MAEKKNNTSTRSGRIDHSRSSTKNTGKQKKGSDNKVAVTIFRLLLVLAFVLLIVSAWRNRIDLSCGNMTQCGRDTFCMCGSGDGFPSTINGSHAAAINNIAGDGIALLSDTSLTIYNSTAKESSVNAHFMSEPAMKTAGRYAMVIDIGASKFRVETASGTIATGEAERPLISCALSHNGCYGMVMQGSIKGEAWLSSVEVFDREGESIHKWHCADSYLTDAALSADGKYFAMVGVNAAKGDLASVILIHKVHSDEYQVQFDTENNIYLSLEYNNIGTLFAVGSNVLTVVSEDGENHVDIPHEGKLIAYDICYDGGVALCVSDELGTMLKVYDARGKERFTARLDIQAQNVSLSGEACAVLGEGLLTAYKLDGTLITQVEANATTGGLLLIDRTAYTVDGMRISQIELQ